MFARMVVTGLLIDPETSLRAVVSKSRLLNWTGLKRTPTHTTPTWKSQAATVPPPRKKTTLIVEAPFQQAIDRQQDLSIQGRPYLRHSWHRIDMIAVIAFWITFFLALSGQEATDDRHLYIFRALSVLRAGRLLVVTSGTTTILHSLKRAGPMLITVSFFLIFAFALFSIIGVQSFRGSFRRHCVYTDPLNSSNVIDLDSLCGGYISSNLEKLSYHRLDGSMADVSPKGYICPLDQVCVVRQTSFHRPKLIKDK